MVAEMKDHMHNAPLLLALFLMASPAVSSPGSVGCEVKSLRSVYRIGDAPELSVKIINRGPEAIYLPAA
jgi:hypothetical protein